MAPELLDARGYRLRSARSKEKRGRVAAEVAAELAGGSQLDVKCSSEVG
jgi:hypothetical protein